MMRNWFELCEAAGYTILKMDRAQLYELAGRIIRDKWLSERAEKFVQGGVLPAGTRVRILRGCSPLELQALRGRLAA
jgi:hypothetical protein